MKREISQMSVVSLNRWRRAQREATKGDDRHVVTVHPPSFNRLLDALRNMDTTAMTTPEVVAACDAVVPGIDIERIVEALRIVGEEHYRDAARLQERR
jgi:hypothetical protein